MSWNSPMEVQYQNHSPYNSVGSFVDFFGSFTCDHVNYIFSDANYDMENAYNSYPASNTSIYKFSVSEPDSFSYYEYGNDYEVDSHPQTGHEFSELSDNPLVMAGHRAAVSTVRQEENPSSNLRRRPRDCPRTHHDARDNEVVWQDSIDPDNMTYEELLELGEAVGTQSRGLSKDQIALLPTSRVKFGLFFRKKCRGERCVICQMEYKRGDKRITLPCKHVYHSRCGRKWLSINKACPVCYKEVIIHVAKK